MRQDYDSAFAILSPISPDIELEIWLLWTAVEIENACTLVCVGHENQRAALEASRQNLDRLQTAIDRARATLGPPVKPGDEAGCLECGGMGGEYDPVVGRFLECLYCTANRG